MRGSRFLPDDSLRFVAIDYQCRVCADVGVTTRLMRHSVTTDHETFEQERTSFLSDNNAVEEQIVDGRFRYRMRCPRTGCTNTPVITAEKLDEALRAVYQPGRRGVIALTI